ncbi:MAG TPA: hypothetical protein PLH94_04630 [Fimbriimonadaceae bacterium]|nr:hypothetical protein [Fimbriimonadaceae bacterium]
MRRFLDCAGVGMSFFASGLVVGLSLIAAAVKFTATRPDLLDLLDVGRVQFAALHMAEWILVPAACTLLAIGVPRLRMATAVTAACFLVKALLLQPALHARMVARLADQSVPESNIHVTYVVASVTLVLLLLAQGSFGMYALSSHTSEK